MIFNYVRADLIRNPRRSLTTVAGVFLGIALTCAVLFFVDGLSASLTQRAVAPLTIDMQRILTKTSADLQLDLFISSSGPQASGSVVEVAMSFKNNSSTPANEVVIRSLPNDSLKYVLGSALLNNQAINPGQGNPFASGTVKSGLNIGTVAPGAVVELHYRVELLSNSAVSEQSIDTSFSTREVLYPVKANHYKQLAQADIADRIRKLHGIKFAEQLSIADLAPGSLHSATTAAGTARIFGFDSSYPQHDKSVKILKGSGQPRAAMISAEIADKLSLGIGDSILIDLPDNTKITKTISGIVDLSGARSLFSSRQGADLETFVYVPNSVVLDIQSFSKDILPAFDRASTTRGERIKSQPIREIDIGIEREMLNAEPSVALKQTEQISGSIKGIEGGGEDFLLDHISNTLKVATDDAKVAKQMFIFLGLPGVILAAILAAYAGLVLSSAQRREQATLRIRGASRKHLLSMLTLRVSLITAVGAVIGVGLGFATSVLVVGLDNLLRATRASLLISAIIGTLAGLLATGLALYFTGRKSINREINNDRAKLVSIRPIWQKYWLDVVGIMIVVAVTVLVIKNSGFRGEPGSVYAGQSVKLSLGLLVLPIAAWLFGCLFGSRIFVWIVSWSKSSTTRMHTQPLHLLYGLSVRRRSWVLAQASFIIGLIIAIGTSLAIFTTSYHGAKNADARYVNGSDIRISPTAASKHAYKSSDATKFQVDTIDSVTPVIYGVHNIVLHSNRTEEIANLAALNPSEYARTAMFENAHFSNGSAKKSLELLAKKPGAILLSSDMADFLQVKVGDRINVLLASSTPDQVEVELTVVGLFEKLPGFPDGADALMNIATYEAAVPTSSVAFFLAQTTDKSDASLERLTRSLRNTIGVEDALQIETRQTALAKDQSSLAALNINGLLKIDSGYSLAMSVTVIIIFVFGLLLSRRREYVTLRAQGMSAGSIRLLICAEAATSALAGTLIGLPVGLVMSYYFINVLRPLFVLTPIFVIPFASLGVLLGLVAVTTLVASLAASSLVSRLKATELLRDE